MDLMSRRRALMSQAAADYWDYVFEAGENGLVPVGNLKAAPYNAQVAIGQKITIAWDATGFDGDSTRMLYLLGSRFDSYVSLSETQAIAKYGQQGQFTIVSGYQVPTASLCVSRSWMDTSGPRFMGKYIKVKIWPVEELHDYLDGAEWVEGKYIDANGVYRDISTLKYTKDPIAVTSGSYLLSGVSTASGTQNYRIHEYTANDVWVKQLSYHGFGAGDIVYYFDVPDDTYIKLSIPIGFTGILIKSN